VSTRHHKVPIIARCSPRWGR